MSILLFIALAAHAEEANHVPALNPIGGKQIAEGQLLEFNISAIDEDNDTLVFDTNASFGTFDKSTGSFSWTPSFDDAGLYFILYNVTDGKNGSSSEIIRLNATDAIPPVNSTNHIPILNLIGGKQIEEGELLEFNITASDLDNDTLTVGTNASIGNLNSSSGLFTWAPGYNDSGYYFIKFYVTDSLDTAFEIIRLNVTDKDIPENTSNHAPVLNLIGGKQILEGHTLDFVMSATDEDNDTLVFDTNASFGFLNSTTGEFTWTTKFTDANLYYVLLNVTDGISSATEIIRLNVTEAGNQNPILFVIEPRGIGVQGNSSISWNSSDPDNDSLSFADYITKRIYDENNTVIGESRTKVCDTTQNQCTFDSTLFPNGIYVAIVVANDSLNLTESYSNDFLINNPAINDSNYTNETGSQESNNDQQSGQSNNQIVYGGSRTFTNEASKMYIPDKYVPSATAIPNEEIKNSTDGQQDSQDKAVVELNNEPRSSEISQDTAGNQISGAVVSQATGRNILLAIIILVIFAGIYSFYTYKIKY